MDNSVKERLKFFIKTQKLSNKRFEEICGLSNGYISSMRKSIGPDSWEKIKKQYPNLNRDWMLYGEGTMLDIEKPMLFIDENLKGRILKFIEIKGLSVKSFESYVGLSNGAVSKMGDNTHRSTLNKISKAFPTINTDWLLTGSGEMEKATPTNEMSGTTTIVVGGQDFSPATDNGNININVESPEIVAKVSDLLAKLKEKDQYIEELKKHIADLRDMISVLKNHIDTLENRKA